MSEFKNELYNLCYESWAVANEHSSWKPGSNEWMAVFSEDLGERLKNTKLIKEACRDLIDDFVTEKLHRHSARE